MVSSFEGKRCTDLGTEDILEYFESKSKKNKLPDRSSFYKKLSLDCEKIIKNSTTSNGFKRRQLEILKKSPDEKKIINLMNSRLYIRPLLGLWCNDNSVMVPCTKELLAHINFLAVSSKKGVLSLLQFKEVVNLFFIKYDLPIAVEVGNLIKEQFSKLKNPSNVLNNLKQKKDELFNKEGHIFFCKLLKDKNTSFKEMTEYFGIPEKSSFFNKCLTTYYIEQIDSLEVNENSSVLRKIVEEKTYELELKKEGQYLLGHYIIISLIDKLLKAQKTPSEFWRSTLTSIAGDPRSTRSRQYVKWWFRIGDEYINAMNRWLSEIDLDLFLKIFKDFSEKEGNDEMLRMYPARKRFLEGIFKKNIVLSSQLFLGVECERFLKETLGKEGHKLYFIKLLQDSKKAVFYIDIGNAKLIEGTHSFKIRIFDKIPQESPLSLVLEGRRFEISYRELGEGLKEKYSKSFGVDGVEQIVHNGEWQKKVVNFLRKRGVDIFLSDVMTEEEYIWKGW